MRVEASRTELIVPAVRGTTSIFNSALKHGTDVKRIVLTSSLAAIREADPNPRTYDETNWNNAAVTAVETKGSGAGPILIYLASKTLAERAAWEFVAKHKAELKWDLVVLNPPWIFGVCLGIFYAPMARLINTSSQCTAISESRADGRRYQHVPASDVRHTHWREDWQAVARAGELGPRIGRRRGTCTRDARAGRWW